MDKLFTCAEIAERYGVKVITVWDWIRKGRLPAVKVGKSYHIRLDDLKQFEELHRVGGRKGG